MSAPERDPWVEALAWLRLYGELGVDRIRPRAQEAPAAQAPASRAPEQEAVDPAAALETLRVEVIGDCQRCDLCRQRNKIVFGTGSPTARLMFVGEGPGAEEDRQGEPFVGRAGQLLDRILAAMGLDRTQVYIGNVVKCRPPDNRAPLPHEAATCLPFLRAQIAIIRPEVIVALGRTALEGLLGEKVQSMSRVRGRWMSFEGIDLMPTFHPAYLLRSPQAKKPVWEDMKAILARLDMPVPSRGH